MRGVVRNADVILLYGLRLLCWCCCVEVSASGGALDAGGHQTFPSRSSPSLGSSAAAPAKNEPTTSPVPPVKITAFSGSYTDGLAKAVAQDAAQSSVETCNDDLACITMASHDRLGLEAIKSLHSQLDDDADGDVDLSESDDFLREELQYEAGYERRQRAFHHNDDMHISVRELWEAWLRSEVHNWTIEQTSEWLTSNVELPQYVPNFIQHRVTGATLPRLAVNNMHYLSNVLGIKDPIHKQKIALKAMDVVLFGPPKDTGHSIKDLILITLLFGALIACWYAYQQKKSSETHVRRLVKDMEGLHNAEIALEDLQKELERARLEQESAATEKENLEKRLQDESLGLHTSYSDLEVSQLKSEIEMLKMELQRAEGELEDRCWSPPVGLQHWLQMTHEIENKAYTKKRISAEKQLQQAREACEKLRKKRSSLVGAFVSTHGKSIDEVDKSIVEARTSLNEVTVELQERVHRWKQIELLCGFNIINNNGLNYLETILYRGAPNGRSFALRGRMSSQDDLDDDASSVYTPSTSGGGGGGGGGAAGATESIGWKESSMPPDSSSSETGKETPPETIKFIVGEGSSSTDLNEQQQQQQQESKSSSREKMMLGGGGTSPRPPPSPKMVRSFSQDANMLVNEENRQASVSSFLSKTCLSENSLGDSTTSRFTSLRNKPLKELSSVVQQSVDDETLSTDSNSTADNDELRRRRRKLHFPAFRKNKTKPT